jgi:hypothetical protein
MKKINWTKANAWIDSYLTHITNPNTIPCRFGRAWLEQEAVKVGLVEDDGQSWEFMESHATWYNALINTGRLYLVINTEKAVSNRGQKGEPTTLDAVRDLLSEEKRNTLAANVFRDVLTAVGDISPVNGHTKVALHPALKLFQQLFEEACKNPGPESVTNYVPRAVFHKRAQEEGMLTSDSWVDALKWEEEVGMPEFAHKLFAKHHKKVGSDFTPMEKGKWRNYRKMKALRLGQQLKGS